MDAVGEKVNRLQKEVGPTDRQRLDLFFTAVREFEKRLAHSEECEYQPRPKVDPLPPQDFLEPELLIKRTQSMFDVIRLAIETDSTRLISVILGQSFNPKVDTPGVELPHHALNAARSSARDDVVTSSIRAILDNRRRAFPARNPPKRSCPAP